MSLARLLLCLSLLVVGACSLEDDLGADDSVADTTSTSAVGGPAGGIAGEAVEPSRATVADVVDGDTIDVDLRGTDERVRIIGINAPETGECLAAAAADWLRERIEGREVTLTADRSDRDGFGRLLRYVELDGDDVGVQLVEAGLAIAREYPPDTARSDRLDAAQDRARRAEAGLWAEATCGPPADGVGDVVIRDVRFDATGDDTTNLNDEWVRIRNDGATPVDLSGWIVKDESASHRYEFPDGFTLAPGASVTVRSGCGTDTDADLHWCVTGSAVWNNDGDTAFLLDPSGNVVSTLSS